MRKSQHEVAKSAAKCSANNMPMSLQALKNGKLWKRLLVKRMTWQADSTYIQHPPFFDDMKTTPDIFRQSKVHVFLHCWATVSLLIIFLLLAPLKPIALPENIYNQKALQAKDFNSYGARRGNHEVMMRGTFANIRIRNEMVPGVEGGFTKYIPTGEVMPIYDAAMRYQSKNISH